jgi:hypothetical protein
MFTKQFTGNSRWAVVKEEINSTFRVYAAEDSTVIATNHSDYESKAKAIRVAKDWIEYGA